MNIQFLLALFTACILLAGCSEEYYYEEVETEEVYTTTYEDPSITYMEIFDSYGDSSLDQHSVSINPYIDDGWFQVNWKVDTYDDYVIEYRVNDDWSEFGSVLVDSEYCGQGLSCDRDGIQFCRYYSDFTFSCDADSRQSVSAEHLVHNVPEQLYFILKVCSTDYFVCESTSMPINVE